MPSVTDLPLVNATLNAIAAAFLVAGWRFIRRGDRTSHRACMQAALACSALFLASYLIYHANVGSRPYTGAGVLRAVYFFVLVTHVVLVLLIGPLPDLPHRARAGSRANMGGAPRAGNPLSGYQGNSGLQKCAPWPCVWLRRSFPALSEGPWRPFVPAT